MKTALESTAKDLSNRLQEDLLRFTGRILAPATHFRAQHLLPVVLLVALTVVVASSSKARNSLWVKMAMLFSTHWFQQDSHQGNTIEKDD